MQRPGIGNSTSRKMALKSVSKPKFFFPDTHYAILSTPNSSDENSKSLYMVFSLLSRLISYFAVLVVTGVVIYLILKSLGACDSQEAATVEEETSPVTETNPILPRKQMPCIYGATEEDLESSLCSSSEDLYNGKICVICYDQRRDCFFVPCGHSVACQTCGQRIMKEENKVCPICRRLIHKVRKLLSP